MMDYSIANFEQAVSQFYYTDAVLQAQAHQWLVAAQTSPNAWSFVWELLQKERSAEVQFFAATTLHMKIMKSWDEVPCKEYGALRKRLFEAVLNYSAGPKIVLNRLCIALSAYILQTMPNYWPNAMSELFAIFQTDDFQGLTTERRAWIILEVLTVIPEEFESMTMIRRHKMTVRHELEKTTPQVLLLVQSVLTETQKSSDLSVLAASNNGEVLYQAVRCATTWLHFGVSLMECDELASLLISVVINSSMNLSNTEVAELGIEALDQMLTHPDASKMPSVVMDFIQRILCLKDIIRHCQEVNNHELMTNLYTLFVSVVEAHSHLILEGLMTEMRDVSLQLLQVILSCTNCNGHYPTQETCSQLTFGVWYILQDEFVNMEPAKYASLLPTLGPVYQELVLILLRKSEYPSDTEEFSSEDKEKFRWYRQDIADTLMYCCNVLHDSVLEILLSQLQNALMTVKSAWQPLESCLHAFASVSENIDEDEKKNLCVFFGMLQTIPFDSVNIIVANTALDVVGAYASWFFYHQDILTHVIPLLLMGLNNSETAPSATMSLKDLTRETQAKMRPYAEVILQTCQRVLSEGKLKQNECIRLMYTIGRVLSLLPLDKILQYSDNILLPVVDQIRSLLNQEPSASVKSNLLVRMKMIGMLLGTLDMQLVNEDEESDISDVNNRNAENKSDQESAAAQQSSRQDCDSQPEPVFIILNHLMHVLNDVVNKWSTDSSVIEAVFSLLKRGVSTILDGCLPLVPNIIDMILNSYKRLPTSSAIDLSKQIAMIVGRSAPLTPNIHNLLLLITMHTLHIAKPESQTGGDLSPFTDVIEMYLQTMSMLISRNPLLILEIEHFNVSDVFQFAMKALMLPELPTVRAAVSFFTSVILQSRDHNALLLMCVQVHGEELVETLLRCIGGEVSRTNIEPLPDILLALNKKHCDNISRWLPAQLARQDFPSSRPSAQVKAQFAKMVLKERVNKRKLQEIVREFSLVCRGLVNTEYAAQTSSRLVMPDI